MLLHPCAADDHQSDDDDGPNTPREPKRSASASRATGQAKAKAGTGGSSKTTAKRKPTGFAAYKHSLHKLLFGWLDPKFKRNGKKLLSSSSVLWRFMVCSLAVLAACVVKHSKFLQQHIHPSMASLQLCSYVSLHPVIAALGGRSHSCCASSSPCPTQRTAWFAGAFAALGGGCCSHLCCFL